MFYDGDCALCHGAVRFLLRRDEDGTLFAFAPLGGETFREARIGRDAEADADPLPDSVVVRTAGGDTLVRSGAAAHLLRRLGGGWRAVGRLLAALPTPLADAAYDLVARTRRRVFGRSKDRCPVPEGPDRERFLP